MKQLLSVFKLLPYTNIMHLVLLIVEINQQYVNYFRYNLIQHLNKKESFKLSKLLLYSIYLIKQLSSLCYVNLTEIETVKLLHFRQFN